MKKITFQQDTLKKVQFFFIKVDTILSLIIKLSRTLIFIII